MKFYEHSGRGGTWGVPMAAVTGILAALVLAVVYVYVLNWIPLIYVSFLATGAFGFAVGAAVGWGAKVGKLRNMTIAVMLGVLVGAIAMYFAWAIDPMARFPQLGRPLWDLESIWQYMQAGYAEGFWSIGRNGTAVTGLFLAAVWVIEAVLVIGLAVIGVNTLLGEQPFCEETNQWTKTQKAVSRLSLEHDEQVEGKFRRLLDGDIRAVSEFFSTDVNANHLQLDLATCEECPTCKFLTVRMIEFETNKKGEIVKKETKLLGNLQISEEELAIVRAGGTIRPEPAPTEPADASDELHGGEPATNT
jgi:hypothetical protein